MLERQTLSDVDLSAHKLYLGVALRESNELVQARANVCSQLGLVPRSEAHVTIAYLGQLSVEQVEELCAELAPYTGDELASFQLSGTGAAWEEEAGNPRLLGPEDQSLAMPHACVAWWSIDVTPTIARLRNAASNLLGRWGRTLPASEPYRPHVTLGSRGRAGIADEDFDIFTLEKGATLAVFETPTLVLATRAHVTASKLLPACVACLRQW